MRFFETDWNVILSWLEVWEKLSPAARSHYLTGKSHAQSVDREGYGADLELALSLGLVEQVSTGRVRPTKASTPFRALMVQLVKWPLFEGKPDRGQLREYLHKHYISDEQRTLSPWRQAGWDSPERSAGFLETNDILAWEQPLLTYYERTGRQPSAYTWMPAKEKGFETWFPKPEITEAAKFLVRCALESKRVWRLDELMGKVPESLRAQVDPALKACFRHALLFAALHPNSFELQVGVCPLILHLENRPTPVPPVVESCADARGIAYHVEDMAQLLALAATDECFLNQASYEQQFFKSVVSRLREDFVPVPEWLAERAEFLERVYSAAESLQTLRFVADTGHKEAKRRLRATAAGRKWLTQSPADRLKEVMFEFQRFWKEEDWDEESGEGSYLDDEEVFDEWDRDEADFEDDDDQECAAKARGDTNPDLLRWQKSVWRQAPPEGCVALEAFLDYHARVSLLSSQRLSGERTATAVRISARGNLADEELCRVRLENFFWRVLAPFGCIEATQGKGGQLRFRLSSAGQYLVGLKRTLQHGPTATDGGVVVQPNFDIVFLAPNLGAEVAIAPFSERNGRSVGTLFKLTREKMILAASRGVKLETVLATLAKHSSTPVPQNVVAEVQAWFGGCRSLVVRHSTLIQAGDPEIALRVKQALGPECEALSATLLEWPADEIPQKLKAKLREQGLFLVNDSRKTAG